MNSRAQYLLNLRPEGWEEIEITVWGTEPGPKFLRIFERNTSHVLYSIPLQDEEAKALGKALSGQAP